MLKGAIMQDPATDEVNITSVPQETHEKPGSVDDIATVQDRATAVVHITTLQDETPYAISIGKVQDRATTVENACITPQENLGMGAPSVCTSNKS